MEKIIADKLAFLIDEYHFKFRFSWTSPNALYIFENQYGQFVYQELPQFREKCFFVIDSQGKRTIDIYKDNLEDFQAWQKKHSGLKWLLRSKEPDLWDFHASIIRRTIEKTNTLFGLRIK